MMHRIAIGILLFVRLCSGAIHSLDHLEPLIEEAKKCDSDTLVLIDLGNTLLQTKDALLHVHYLPWIDAWYKKNCPKITPEKIHKNIKILQHDPNIWELDDAKWMQVISTARAAGARICGFTRIIYDPQYDGQIGERLRKRGIDIRNDLPELKSGELFQYHDGIIATESQLKGPVLGEVVRHLKKAPKKILFIDDLKHNIESVDQECQSLKIACIAFHYIPNLEVPLLNEEIANLQMKTLNEKQCWLSDSAAKAFLNQNDHD